MKEKQLQARNLWTSSTLKKMPFGFFQTDMYPLCWAPNKGGFIMRYSYEFKLECIELYKQGKYPDTPKGIDQRNFRIMIRRWVRQVEGAGEVAVNHSSSNKNWTIEEKYSLISQVLAGKSCQEVSLAAGIGVGQLYSWVKKYKIEGYQGLNQKRGRPFKEPFMKKIEKPREITPSELEELIRLRTENEYLKTENSAIKKSIALRQERIAAQLKAKKQQSSKNSGNKDIN